MELDIYIIYSQLIGHFLNIFLEYNGFVKWTDEAIVCLFRKYIVKMVNQLSLIDIDIWVFYQVKTESIK